MASLYFATIVQKIEKPENTATPISNPWIFLFPKYRPNSKMKWKVGFVLVFFCFHLHYIFLEVCMQAYKDQWLFFLHI